LGLDNVIRPATVVISKLPIENEPYERIFYGAGQLGIAQGVMDAVRDGLIDEQYLGDICLLVACWIDPGAHDETKVRLNTRDAMFRAIRNALTLISKESIQKQLQSYETARNNFYSGE
jgi:5,6,7,8-tetrahydromethanopterin hydro-lyase